MTEIGLRLYRVLYRFFVRYIHQFGRFIGVKDSQIDITEFELWGCTHTTVNVGCSPPSWDVHESLLWSKLFKE